jgi:hypothetical protein
MFDRYMAHVAGASRQAYTSTADPEGQYRSSGQD